MNFNHITAELIHSEDFLDEVVQPEAGAIVTFLGLVRDHNKGEKVTGLFYEAYETMAEKDIKTILEDARTKWNLHKAICVHRIGDVSIGEATIIILTSSSHRSEAYEANRFILDRAKFEAPIRKKEFFANGKVEWGRNSEVDTEL